MGYEIKTTKKGLYKVTETTTGEKMFGGKAVTVDEVKKMLITERIWKFMEDVSKIEHDFPNGWTVDDRRVYDRDHKSYNELWLENSDDSDTLSEFITTFYEQTMKKHGLSNIFNLEQE